MYRAEFLNFTKSESLGHEREEKSFHNFVEEDTVPNSYYLTDKAHVCTPSDPPLSMEPGFILSCAHRDSCYEIQIQQADL